MSNRHQDNPSDSLSIVRPWHRGARIAVFLGTSLFALAPTAHAVTLKGKPLYASQGYSTTPTTSPFRGVILSDVKINGGQISSPVPVGSTVTVSGNYFIAQDAGCPGCILQIEVGLATGATPQACIFAGGVPPAGASGNFSYTFAAPARKGTYVLAFDRGEDFFCFASSSAWGSGVPLSNYARWFGVLTVQ